MKDSCGEKLEGKDEQIEDDRTESDATDQVSQEDSPQKTLYTVKEESHSTILEVSWSKVDVE